MRPRKKIYLHCRDKTRRGVLSFVLRTWHFCVITELPEGSVPDVALIVNDRDAYDLVLKLDRDFPEVRILILIKRRGLTAFDDKTGAVMLDDQVPMIGLREHVQTAAARKRGPKHFQIVPREAA
jgi:hypothetical protein